jgi:hypothetical protein
LQRKYQRVQTHFLKHRQNFPLLLNPQILVEFAQKYLALLDPCLA